ncbi:hypothetical protein AAY473_019535 [Plecturocebus cupreus]
MPCGTGLTGAWGLGPGLSEEDAYLLSSLADQLTEEQIAARGQHTVEQRSNPENGPLLPTSYSVPSFAVRFNRLRAKY